MANHQRLRLAENILPFVILGRSRSEATSRRPGDPCREVGDTRSGAEKAKRFVIKQPIPTPS